MYITIIIKRGIEWVGVYIWDSPTITTHAHDPPRISPLRVKVRVRVRVRVRVTGRERNP